MAKKKQAKFSVTKAVKRNARERVGQPKPEKIIVSEPQREDASAGIKKRWPTFCRETNDSSSRARGRARPGLRRGQDPANLHPGARCQRRVSHAGSTSTASELRHVCEMANFILGKGTRPVTHDRHICALRERTQKADELITRDGCDFAV